jgi:DNA (cytosine-5)-methyltransferase 1
MRLLHEVKPKYFLLENVMMGEKWEKVLSKSIGVNAIEINSSLVSAQNRRRLYWTNIGMESGGLFGDLESIIQQPKDKNILLKHILESNVDEKYFLSDKMISWLDRHSIKMGIEIKKLNENQKSSCLTSSAQTKQNLSTDYIIQNREVRQLNPSLESGGVQPYQQNRVYDADGISPALCAFKSDLNIKLNNQIRRLTPVECERLQTVKDNYTNYVSDSQRYRMLGNGWTVDVIAHIFGYIK